MLQRVALHMYKRLHNEWHMFVIARGGGGRAAEARCHDKGMAAMQGKGVGLGLRACPAHNSG